MKIADTVTSTDTNSAFTIAATGKAFKILSDGLYSDKIRAIIRELACNARDSHVAAGNTAPWAMHLPTYDEEWFSVEDFGTGMSHEDVMNVYSRYFASTKTASNEFVGQLGLGSKSPFSYTREFFVTSRYAGVENRYRMYFDDSDTPRVDHIASGPAASTGIKVRFAVTSGTNRWHSKAADVLCWFEQKPTCNVPMELAVPSPSWTGQGWRVWDKNFWNNSGCHVLMGGVLYPMDRYSVSDLDADLHTLCDLNLVMEMPIGDCDVAASREGLSYDIRTVGNITARLSAVLADVRSMINDDIASAPTKWVAYQQYARHFSGPNSWIVRKLFDSTPILWQGTDITRATMPIDCAKLYGTPAGTSQHGVRNLSSGYKSVRAPLHLSLSCNEHTRIVFDDSKTGGLARARKLHADGGHKQQVVLFPPRGDWEALRADLGHPDVIYTSTLPAVPKTAKLGSKVQVWEWGGRVDVGKSAWIEIDATTLPDQTPRYYVTVKGWTPSVGHRQMGWGMGSFVKDAVKLGLLKADARIYAVRPTAVRKLEKQWVSLHDHLAPQVQQLFAEPKTQALYRAQRQNFHLEGALAHNFGKLINQVDALRMAVRERDGELLRFLDAAAEIRNNSRVDISAHKHMQQHFNIEMPEDNSAVPEVARQADRVAQKYAMLRFVSMGHNTIERQLFDDIVRYIDLVDVGHAFMILSKGDPEIEE